MTGRIRAFMAMSLDGFIAGPDDDLSWLSSHGDGEIEDTFTPFMAGVGSMLMGRRTFEIVSQMPGAWPYGRTPVLVATQRPLAAAPDTVRAASGSIDELVGAARAVASGKDVYVDGGDIVRQALDAELIDEMTITVISIVLGRGISLFNGLARPHALVLSSHRRLAPSMLELTYVARSGRATPGGEGLHV